MVLSLEAFRDCRVIFNSECQCIFSTNAESHHFDPNTRKVEEPQCGISVLPSTAHWYIITLQHRPYSKRSCHKRSPRWRKSPKRGSPVLARSDNNPPTMPGGQNAPRLSNHVSMDGRCKMVPGDKQRCTGFFCRPECL